MAEAQRRLPDLSGPTWILAHHQTGATGRRGRAWAHPPGNFAATLVMRPESAPAEAALRSFTAAVALQFTLALQTQGQKLSLKWPNDVLLNGGKVAGILLESTGAGASSEVLSIGIGVNLQSVPPSDKIEPDALRPVSVAGEGGSAFAPEEFLQWLAYNFATQEQSYRKFGFAPIRQLWLNHAARIGEVIRVRTGNDDIEGTFETIDPAGNLVLLTAKGRQAIPAGDVYF